jgi:hypothetical protein
MVGSSSNRPYSKVEYQALRDDEDGRRDSINSSSPILDKTSIEEFDQDSIDEEVDLDQGAFATDGLETFYKPIEGYEGAHRFDPNYRWSNSDEGKVVWKVGSHKMS